MKRTATALSIITLTLVGVGLFNVAQNVRDYEAQLKTLTTKIDREQETIHTLRAEWVFLNQPDRLEKLAKKHTDLKITNEKNLIALSVVPLIAPPEIEEIDGEENVAETVKKEASGYQSYISKVNKKSKASSQEGLTAPIHQISLRDIWGQ